MATMKANDWSVGMCADCDEVKMMPNSVKEMGGNATKCDACGNPLTWKG